MDRAGRARSLRTIWSQVAANYYDPTMQGLAWSVLGDELIAGLPEHQSSEEFYRYINRGLAVLRDVHTRVSSPAAVLRRRRDRAVTLGIEINASGLILEVMPSSEAEAAGLRPGMRIAAINGERVSASLARLRREEGLETQPQRITPAWRRYLERVVAARLLAGAPGPVVNFRIAEIPDREIALRRLETSYRIASTSRTVGPGIAYVELTEFSSRSVAILRERLANLAGVTGVIIDLRRNGGGDTRDALRAAGMFFPQPVPFGSIVSRDGRRPSFLGGLYRLPMSAMTRPDPARLVNAPMVLLVGASTASAAEGFVSALRDNGRATIVGSLTCGCANIVLRTIRLPDGGELRVSNLGSRSPRGAIIEGTGITPDVEVASELRGGLRDEALEAGIRVLNDRRR